MFYTGVKGVKKTPVFFCPSLSKALWKLTSKHEAEQEKAGICIKSQPVHSSREYYANAAYAALVVDQKNVGDDVVKLRPRVLSSTSSRQEQAPQKRQKQPVAAPASWDFLMVKQAGKNKKMKKTEEEGPGKQQQQAKVPLCFSSGDSSDCRFCGACSCPLLVLLSPLGRSLTTSSPTFF